MPGASASPPASTRCAAAPSSRPLGSPLIAAMRPSLTARLPSRAGVPRPSMMRACSITRSCATSAFLLGMRGGGIGHPAAAPFVRARSSVSSGLKVVGGPAAVVRLARAISALMAATRSTHVRLGAKGPDLVEHAIGLGADLEGRGQDRELLALEELLDPPHRIVRLLDAGDGPALALEPVELAVRAGRSGSAPRPTIPSFARVVFARSWRAGCADDTRW